MGTSAEISYYNQGKLYGIYSHYDGYLEPNVGVGVTLLKHYQDPKKIRKLISLGDISFLDEKVEPEGDTHSFANPEDGVTVAYKRDRGETGTDAKVKDVNVSNTEELLRLVYNEATDNYSYVYVQSENMWYFIDLSINKFNAKPLAQAYKELVGKLKKDEEELYKPRGFITREQSVEIARELRKDKRKTFVVFKNSDDTPAKMVLYTSVADTIHSAYVKVSWDTYQKAVKDKPTQAKLADYIYKKSNYEVNKASKLGEIDF